MRKLLRRFFSLKGFILNLAITASTFASSVQVDTQSHSQSARTRRRFGEFEEDDILLAAHACKTVYNEFWEHHSKEWGGILGKHTDTNYDTFYSILEDKNGNIFVAFRGTEISSWKNISTDLWANWAHNKKTDSLLHNGFMKAYLNIHENLYRQLKNIADKKSISLNDLLENNVYFTGHSMGGALAQLAALFFLEETFEVKTICFSAPVTVTALTADRMNTVMKNKIVHVQKDYDPVPYFSHFSLFGFGYDGAHPGITVKIPFLDSFSLNPKTLHSMEYYVKTIKDFCENKINETKEHFIPTFFDPLQSDEDYRKLKNAISNTEFIKMLSETKRKVYLESIEKYNDLNMYATHQLNDAKEWVRSNILNYNLFFGRV